VAATISAVGDNDTQRLAAISAVVDELEAVLKRMERWEERSPDAARLASTLPFSYDKLDFHQWLQWQLIPRMRRILEGNGDLPTRSAIHPYAEEFLRPEDARSAELLFLIGHFDALITGDKAPASAH
jgi:uncharacterized protein YqcC (DUF446 family)